MDHSMYTRIDDNLVHPTVGLQGRTLMEIYLGPCYVLTHRSSWSPQNQEEDLHDQCMDRMHLDMDLKNLMVLQPVQLHMSSRVSLGWLHE